MYRTYKKFDTEKYNYDLLCAPFHVGEIFDSIDDSYWYYETLVKGIVDEHAPMKCKTVRHNQVPYMNGQLRRAINYKNMLKRRFERNKNSISWDLYRKHRNYVLKLRRKSLSSYLNSKCIGPKNPSAFWDAVKPLVSDKCKGGQNNVILLEDGTIVNDQTSVCKLFNSFLML